MRKERHLTPWLKSEMQKKEEERWEGCGGEKKDERIHSSSAGRGEIGGRGKGEERIKEKIVGR